MGSALYIVLEKDIPGLDVVIDGKAISRSEKTLERLCHRLGVRPLMEFFSVNPVEIFDLMDGEEMGIEVPGEHWFTAEEGLKTVDALVSEVRADPDLAYVTTDLLGLQRVLGEAMRQGVRWHLAVDY